jgi:hypothetical protein
MGGMNANSGGPLSLSSPERNQPAQPYDHASATAAPTRALDDPDSVQRGVTKRCTRYFSVCCQQTSSMPTHVRRGVQVPKEPRGSRIK